jgi:tetratricopeptide (TPR) repeat protein
MLVRTLALLLLTILGPGLAGPLAASVEDAASAYRRGAALERAGDNASAVVEYQASLAHDPAYFYAWRQIGNCYARERLYASAVDAYQHYLDAKPGDAAVRAYSDRLRQAAHLPAPSNNEFYAGLALHPVLLSVADFAAMVPDGSTKPSGGLGVAYGVEGGWRHSSGAYVQAGYLMGLSKRHQWKESNDTVTNTLSAGLSSFYVAPGYQMRLPLGWGVPISVGGHLGLGLAALSYEYDNEIPSAGIKNDTAVSQSGLFWMAQAHAEARVWRGLDLGAALGYQGAQLSEIDGSNGAIKDTQGNNAKLDMGGLLLELSAHYSF